jgi:hypothetical protein
MVEGATDGTPSRTPPSVKVARWVLFALLIASAALTLFGVPEMQRAVAAGRWPPIALAVPPALLAVFIVGYAAYRLVLVRAGRYTAGKALVQVAVMILVLGIVARVALVPAERAGPGQTRVELARALASTDPDVRALAAEVARHRPREEALAVAVRLAELVEDPSPEVRRQAHASLVAIAGRDEGGEGTGAADRWRTWIRGVGSGR